MLMPKRVKYRKQMRGRMKGKESRGVEISFGEYGLQALEPGWVTARQIEAARRTIVHAMKREYIRFIHSRNWRYHRGSACGQYELVIVEPGLLPRGQRLYSDAFAVAIDFESFRLVFGLEIFYI